MKLLNIFIVLIDCLTQTLNTPRTFALITQTNLGETKTLFSFTSAISLLFITTPADF